ncbi:MAG TPA: phospholipase C, phosphocholine-specific [Holophagaceae bacterium]|nr:phospholipase C, phosphocholine-specific [Holophagaceae bacterium]
MIPRSSLPALSRALPGLALVVAGALPCAARATGTVADVQHVVIFMQENRSFDHYFGTLKGTRGFGDRVPLRLKNGKSDFYQPSGRSYELPFHTSSQCLNDTAHDWTSTHTAWNGGNWDQWVSAKGAESMVSYDRSDLSFYYALADAYTLCDDYHCSVMGPTDPNRLYLFTGMVDPSGTGGGPVIDNTVPASGFTWTTYPERLQAAGVSWKVYQETNNYGDNALAWFSQFMKAQPGTPLYDRGMAMSQDLVAEFKADVANNTLPKVSWIIAPDYASEHPVWSPASGESLTQQLLQALASNPQVANSTVFMLTYDENDGFFDHVVPPVPAAGTAAEFVNGQPIGLGVRVPMLLVSPWSRGGYACSEILDHTSIIRFLERCTGVQEPNISAWRRQACGDLTAAFDFANPDFSQPTLPSATPVTCASGTTPKPPKQQMLPVQEAGTKPARALPYQPNAISYADCVNGLLRVSMHNTGTASAHFAIYPNQYRTDGPWQYDVAGGSSHDDTFNVVTYGGGFYDLTCYGPNSFLRQFAGNFNVSCGQVEVSSSIDPTAGTLTLSLSNASSSAVTFTVKANAYRTDGPWFYTVPAGGTVSNTWNAAASGQGWYDLSVTESGDTTFLRRLVGHIENGSPSVTAN